VAPFPRTYLRRLSATSKPEDAQIIVQEICEKHLQDQQRRAEARTSQRSNDLRGLKAQHEQRLNDLNGEINILRERLAAMGGGDSDYRVSTKDVELQELLKVQAPDATANVQSAGRIVHSSAAGKRRSEPAAG